MKSRYKETRGPLFERIVCRAVLPVCLFLALLVSTSSGCGLVKPIEPAAPPVATPTPTPVVRRVTLFVGNTNGLGVYIRRTPSADDTLKPWPEGTQMIVIGADRTAEGRSWKNVQDPDGNVGWIPSDYLVTAAQLPKPSPTVLVRIPTPTPTLVCALSNSDVTVQPRNTRYDGDLWLEITVRNPCDQPVNAAIESLAKASKDGATTMDAPTIWINDLGPRETKTLVGRIPRSSAASWVSWIVSTPGTPDWCSGVAAGKCIPLDPWLTSAYVALMGTDEGRQLVSVARVNGIRVVRGETDVNVLGRYRPSVRTITISTRLDAYSSWARAAVLSHELQHAADDVTIGLPTSSSGCYRAEEEAFRTEASVWGDLWANRLPPDVDTVHSRLNDIALQVSRDPVGFAISLVPLYGEQCEG